MTFDKYCYGSSENSHMLESRPIANAMGGRA